MDQETEWTADEGHIDTVDHSGSAMEDEGKVLISELMALADIRQVIGDPHGKLTQDELASSIKRLRLERDELYRDYHQMGAAWETASAMVADRDTLAAQNSALKKWIRIARGFPKERGPYKDRYELDQAALKLLNEYPATHLTEIKAQTGGSMQKLKIYIAGPMTGYANDNRGAFNQKAALLRQQGHCVLNPATLPAGLEQREYMDICYAMIRAANTLHMLEGWQNSTGAQAEYHCAIKLGLTITFEESELNEEVTY